MLQMNYQGPGQQSPRHMKHHSSGGPQMTVRGLGGKSMMTELGMEWSAAGYRGTNKLQVGVNGQHNADIMEFGVVTMV